MMASLYLRTLFDKRWFIVGWSAALGAMVALIAAFFPSFSGSGAYQDLLSNMPEQLKGFIGDPDSFTKLPNYIATQLYDIRVPMFTMIMSLVLAQGLSVGIEEKGLLRTTLATPLSRGRILFETWLAGATVIGLVSLVTAGATYVGIMSINETLPHELIWRLGALSCLSGIAAFSLPLAVGFATGKRALTLTFGLIVTVGSFIISSFAMAVDWLKDIEAASLLYYYDTNALLEGSFNSRDIWVLSGLTLASLVAAWLAFRHRDTKG